MNINSEAGNEKLSRNDQLSFLLKNTKTLRDAVIQAGVAPVSNETINRLQQKYDKLSLELATLDQKGQPFWNTLFSNIMNGTLFSSESKLYISEIKDHLHTISELLATLKPAPISNHDVPLDEPAPLPVATETTVTRETEVDMMNVEDIQTPESFKDRPLETLLLCAYALGLVVDRDNDYSKVIDSYSLQTWVKSLAKSATETNNNSLEAVTIMHKLSQELLRYYVFGSAVTYNLTPDVLKPDQVLHNLNEEDAELLLRNNPGAFNLPTMVDPKTQLLILNSSAKYPADTMQKLRSYTLGKDVILETYVSAANKLMRDHTERVNGNNNKNLFINRIRRWAETTVMLTNQTLKGILPELIKPELWQTNIANKYRYTQDFSRLIDYKTGKVKVDVVRKALRNKNDLEPYVLFGMKLLFPDQTTLSQNLPRELRTLSESLQREWMKYHPTLTIIDPDTYDTTNSKLKQKLREDIAFYKDQEDYANFQRNNPGKTNYEAMEAQREEDRQFRDLLEGPTSDAPNDPDGDVPDDFLASLWGEDEDPKDNT